jgi:hypothetical protein
LAYRLGLEAGTTPGGDDTGSPNWISGVDEEDILLERSEFVSLVD